MRKHSPRKWLHFILDLLPVIMIPVFMVYSHRHDIDSYSVNYEVQKDTYESVQVQSAVHAYNTNHLSTPSDFVLGNYYYFQFKFYRTDFATSNNWTQEQLSDLSARGFITDGDIGNNSKYFGLTPDFLSTGYEIINIRTEFIASFSINTNNPRHVSIGDDTLKRVYLDFNSTVPTTLLITSYSLSEKYGLNTPSTIYEYIQNSTGSSNYYPKYLDLEYIFKYNGFINSSTFNGAGVQEMIDTGVISSLPDSINPLVLSGTGSTYYNKTQSSQSVTYDDTDIMSQLTYNMYNVVTKYFNFNNVATFGAMYDWLVANMFNGSAPLIAPIIWNIILYEFIIDLIFLIYSAFMFFIDFAEKCLDAFYSKSFGGGR